MNSINLKRIVIGCFVLVPFLSSIISTVHLVDLFHLGNPSWISITISVAIEIGAIASFLTLSILSRLNKGIVWSMFFLLFFMQIIGNVYFSYDWVTKKMIENPTWLKSFVEILEFFLYNVEEKTAKMILAMVVGVPIPLISVFLLKSTVDYLGDDREKSVEVTTYEKDEEIDPISEIPVEKKQEEPEIHIQEPVVEHERNRLHPSQY